MSHTGRAAHCWFYIQLKKSLSQCAVSRAFHYHLIKRTLTGTSISSECMHTRHQRKGQKNLRSNRKFAYKRLESKYHPHKRKTIKIIIKCARWCCYCHSQLFYCSSRPSPEYIKWKSMWIFLRAIVNFAHWTILLSKCIDDKFNSDPDSDFYLCEAIYEGIV